MLLPDSVSLAQWEVTGLTFGGGVTRAASGDRVEPTKIQVSIYRTVKEVPAGKKRAVTYKEPVLQGVVMSMEAWKELSTTLAASGARVEEKPRTW